MYDYWALFDLLIIEKIDMNFVKKYIIFFFFTYIYSQNSFKIVKFLANKGSWIKVIKHLEWEKNPPELILSVFLI